MRSILILLLALACARPAFAQMSDSDAMLQAQSVLGPLAMIGMARNLTDTYWTKQIGVKSTGCKAAFSVLASDVNTWNAAFAALTAKPPKILGPFKGPLSISIQAWDAVQVTAMTLYVDGVQFPSLTPPTVPLNPMTFTAKLTLDTTLYADGNHVLCAQAADPTALIGYSDLFLFQTNQTTGALAGSITNPPTGTPSLGVAVIVASQ